MTPMFLNMRSYLFGVIFMSLYFKKSSPLLVDREFANKRLKFFSTDNEDEFKKNSKKMPNNWKYHQKTIQYNFNSLGYRTQEIKDISKPFLLATGCSYTEGVGLNTEDIWCNILANELQLDLVNIGKQGSSPEVLQFNSLLWKANNLPLPELVVAQWPQITRKQFGFEEDDSIRWTDMSETSTHDGKWWGNRYIQDMGELKKSVCASIESFNLVWQSLGVPVINFSWDEELDFLLSVDMQYINPTAGSMEARDCMHDGVEFHRQTADEILASYKV